MPDIENTIYQVYIENHADDILHTGTIWECERWVSKNGLVETSYIIDRQPAETKKPRKKREAVKHSKKVETKDLFNVTMKPLF